MNKTKRIDVTTLPGAKKHNVRWLLGDGVSTTVEARKAAETFISDLDKPPAHTSRLSPHAPPFG